jgi:hypothetical protein
MHLCIVEIYVLQGLDSCPEKREFEKRRKSRRRQGGKLFHLTQVELETRRMKSRTLKKRHTQKSRKEGRETVTGILGTNAPIMSRRANLYTSRHTYWALI